MSKHSDNEFRMTAKYLQGRANARHLESGKSKDHYYHVVEFRGQKVKYIHGGQRPSVSENIVMKDTERGVFKELVRLGRTELADQWRTSNNH